MSRPKIDVSRDGKCTDCGNPNLEVTFSSGGGMCRRCVAYYRSDSLDRENVDLGVLAQPSRRWKRNRDK